MLSGVLPLSTRLSSHRHLLNRDDGKQINVNEAVNVPVFTVSRSPFVGFRGVKRNIDLFSFGLSSNKQQRCQAPMQYVLSPNQAAVQFLCGVCPITVRGRIDAREYTEAEKQGTNRT